MSTTTPTPTPILPVPEDFAGLGVDWSERKVRRVRRSRRLTGAGGLLLTLSFFLPAVPVCNSPFVPSEQWVEAFEGSSLPEPGDLAFLFLYCGAAYLFGASSVVAALRSRTYRRSTERSLGRSASILLGCIAGLIIVGMAVAVSTGSLPSDPGEWAFALFVLIGTAYWLRSLKMGAAGLLWCRWFLALSCLLWFGANAVFNKPLYGLWISLGGATLIFIGTMVEATVRSSCDGWGTLWKMLRCRLKIHDLDGERCQVCDYLLVGLTSARCPECGEPFAVADMDAPGCCS